MNFNCIIFFTLFYFICSDDHIPREADSKASEPKVMLDLQQKEIIQAEVKPDDIKSDAERDPHPPDLDLALKLSAKTVEDAILPNAGINAFRDSSYVSFTVLVGKRGIDCYYYKARKTFDLDFQVVKGGDFDIGVSVFDFNGKLVGSHKSAGDGSLKVAVPAEMIDTDYSICLDNQKSSWHVKKVFIMLDVEGPNGVDHPDVQFNAFSKMENHINKLDLMNLALTNVYQSLMSIEQLQSKTRLTEAIDRSIMESNFEYVTLWAIVQIALMVIVSVLQLLMIRSLFDSRGGVGAKVWAKFNDLTGRRF